MKFLFFLMSLNFVHGSTSSWINCCMVLISQNIELAKMFIWGFCKMLRKPQLNFLVNPILSVLFVILSWNFARCSFFSHDVIKKSSCALTTETQTLPGGVCSEVRVCLQGVKQGNKALDRKIRHKLSKGPPFQWFKLRTSSKIRSFSQ